MDMAIIGNRVRAGVLLTLSLVVLLMPVMNHATPAMAQDTSAVMVSNLGQPKANRHTSVESDKYYAQPFCTGTVAVTLDKVRVFMHSVTAEGNPEGYTERAGPVMAIRSDSSGNPGPVLHTLTSPVIDLYGGNAEDFTSSGYELAANTTYWVALHRPIGTGHTAFFHTTSPSENTGTKLGWTIGDQYLYTSDYFGWTDFRRKGFVMQMAIYASGLPSISTPSFIDCDGTAASYELSVNENSPGDTVVGTALAGDADGDSLTYSVSGTGAAKFNTVFNLNASTGEITVKPGASIDYESSDKSYSVTVSVTDGEDASGDAESDPTIDASVSVRIEVNNIDDPGIVTLSVPTPTVDSALRASFSDQDGGSMLYKVQWSRADAATGPFVDIDGANRFSASDTDSYYTPTAADQGKYLKATMSYFQRRCGVLHIIDDPCRIMPGETSDNRVAAARSRNSVREKVPNSRATGGPSITGTPLVGETLTANTTGISDSDGMTSAVFAHQWVRHDLTSATDTDIEGATDSTYTVVDADAGEALKVRVNFTDDVGNAETLTSNAVAASPPVVVPEPMTATTHDAPESHDGATAFTFELRFNEAPVDSFSYTTVRDHAFTVNGGEVDNARRLEPGKNVRWEITVTPDSDADVTIALNATTDCSAEGAICNADGGMLGGDLELVVPGPQENSAATGAPTINGTAQVGETLTASTSGISDADDLANASFTYQWLADDTEISGATGSSYTVAAADEGKVIKVTVSFTDDADNAETLTSAATAAVALPALRLQTAAVDGATLTLSYNNDLEQDVTLPTSAFTVTVAANTRSVGSASVSGRAVTLTLASAVEAGEAVTVSYARPDGSSSIRDTQGNRAGSFSGETVTNNTAAQENSAATGAPAINGTAQVGETLTASTSGISDSDGLANASFTYQWLADDAEISGATGSSYILVAGDVGKVIKVTVSFTDDEGNEESVTSAATVAVTQPPLTATTHDVPESHDGATGFTFELRFSENIEGLSYKTLQEHALTVTGGTLPKVRRLEPGKNVGWEITVQPSSNADVTIALPITTSCAADGAICTGDGRKLSSRVELTISGPGG